MKPEVEFRWHSGYLSRKCLSCINAKRRTKKAENPEKVRAYDREYYLRRDRQTYYKERYLKFKGDAQEREKVEARIAKWQSKHPEKVRAHVLLNLAIRAGKIKRQSCVKCGAVAEGHHEDYSKPLEVVWLCKKHHGERHREMNEEKRKSA